MGLFKGMKDLKDLSQHHGGMPSIRDSFKDIGEARGRPRREGGPEERRGREGRRQGLRRAGAGREVRDAHPARDPPAERRAVRDRLRVPDGADEGGDHRRDGDPGQGAARPARARRRAVGRAAGVDRGRRRRHGRRDAGPQATYGGAADAAMRQAQANAAAEDPAAKLEKLGQMRDSGLITPEEFEAKKKEILSAM